MGVMDEIRDFIYREGYDSYSLLLQYASENRPDWCRVLRNRTIYVKKIMRAYARDVVHGVEVPPVHSLAWERQKIMRKSKLLKDGIEL